MKKIQLNLKKRDRDNLKHISNTYEDTHMKETSKLENDVNPDVFLMNMQLKNEDNAHLFNMDFSEFLPTVQKKPELESIHEQEPSHLMKDITLGDDDGGDSFSFLDKLDNIDKLPEKLSNTTSDISHSPRLNSRSYSKDTISSKRSYSKDTISSKRSYSKQSIQSTQTLKTLNVIKEDEPLVFKESITPITPISKPILNKNDNMNDFKNQLLKLNSYKLQTLNKYEKRNTNYPNNMKLRRKNMNTFQNSKFKTQTQNKREPLYVNTTHQIPNDPIFKEPLLNNYIRPKLASPKCIPPPKMIFERPLSPTRIEFPQEKELREQERMELETQYTQVLPRGNLRISKPMVPISKPMVPISKPITYNSKPITYNSKPISKPIEPGSKRKMSYKKALYKVLKNKNKINSNNCENIPKKVLKDLYRFSNKIDINYSIKMD